MKFLVTVLLFIAATLMAVHAQCLGAPRRRACHQLAHTGDGGRGCIPRNMWFYSRNSGSCRPLRYLGCGGNGNRYCTREQCERACRR